ncbi:MAG TPA: hypothetical protein VGG45_20695 [Terracidiphilus sp.]
MGRCDGAMLLAFCTIASQVCHVRADPGDAGVWIEKRRNLPVCERRDGTQFFYSDALYSIREMPIMLLDGYTLNVRNKVTQQTRKICSISANLKREL